MSVILQSSPSLAQTSPATSTVPGPQQAALPTSGERRGAVEQYLRHIYAVYLGIRACSEISASQNDRSFMPEVTLEDARHSLRLIDNATREVGIDPSRVWNDGAPTAVITAEALKVRPETHLLFCQRMGSLFRQDAGNLQANLKWLGAKSAIITKDY